MRYSVVVPSYNAAATIEACLRALLNQSISRDAYEVIVVDDGSADATAELAARYPISILRQAHAGPAAARNVGTRAARGELLLFTDADCQPIETWIEAIVRPLERDPDVVGVKGAYRTRQDSLVARFCQVEFEEKYARLSGERYIDFVDTSSAAFRRSALSGLGGFDESFTQASNEDTQLSYSLAERGARLVFAADAIVYHRHPESLARYLVRKWRHGYWRVRVYTHHPARLGGDSYTPRSLQVQFAAVALMLVASPCRRLRVVASFAGLVFLIATYPFVRRAVPRGWDVAAMTPPMLLLRAIALGIGLLSGLMSVLLRTVVAGLPWRRSMRATGRP